MRYLKPSVILLAMLGLSACAKMGVGGHSKDYTKSAMVSPIVVPRGAQSPKEQSYYAAPKNVNANASSPSLIPPGSKVLQYQREAKAAKSKTRLASAGTTQSVGKRSQLADNSQTLVLAMKPSVAWTSIGKALASAHYQVLDEDNQMGTYFILDAQATQGKITNSTPIYRLVIKKSGASSAISLFDKSNKPLDTQIAKRVLTTLQKTLA